MLSVHCRLWASRLEGGDPGELMMAESWWEGCMKEGVCVQMGDVWVLMTVITVATVC